MDDDGEDLHAHVRRILYHYSLQHLTFNYLDFTEQAVAEILSQCLREIPLTSKNSLRLPTEPYHDLTRIHKLNDLEQYHDTFKMSTDEQHFFHRQCQKILTKPGKIKSERVVYDDEYSCNPPEEHLPTMLSRRARTQTPKPGSNQFFSSIPSKFEKFLESKPVGIRRVAGKRVEDEHVNKDKLLNITWNLTPDMLKNVNILLRSTAVLSFPGSSYKHQYLDPETREDSPPPKDDSSSLFERDFMPIFPRSARAGTGRAGFDKITPVTMKDLAIAPTEVKEFKKEEDELYKQNMLLVNGWETYNYSSSPVPTNSPSTPGSSQDVDELFSRLSSPSTDLSSFDTKMDLPAIPRSARIEGAKFRQKVKHLGAGKSLAAFLLNSLPPIVEPRIPVEDIEPVDSVVGQATSAVEDEANARRDSSQECRGLYEHLAEDPMRFILNERLDHNTMMMDVPRLPPPTTHPPNAIVLPTTLSDLVLETRKGVANTTSVPKHGPRILRKTKGTQAATLALSWVTFSVQHRLPTHMEVIGVDTSQLIDRDDNKNGVAREQIEEEVARLVDRAVSCQALERNWEAEETGIDVESESEDVYRCDLILTRDERRRLAGFDTVQQKNSLSNMKETGAKEQDGEATRDKGFLNFEDDYLEGSSDKENEDPEDAYESDQEERPFKRTRTEDNIDDSGIAFTMDIQNKPWPDTREICAAHQGDKGMDRFLYDGTQDGEAASMWTLEQDAASQISIPSFEPAVDFHESRNDLDDHEFHPLCFDSQTGQPLPEHDSRPEETLPPMSAPSEPLVPPTSPHRAPAQPTTNATVLPPSLFADHEMERHHIAAGIAEFARLRAKRLQEDVPAASIPEPPPYSGTDGHISADANEEATTCPPQDLFTQTTLGLPSPWTLPTSVHYYLASMSLIQRQALVRSLRSETCGVGLIEREDLGGVDLILDPHTAIIFANLRALPSECDTIVANISDQSWRYERVLVVLEAFPPSWSFKPSNSHRDALNVYTPPVIKAVKKLRRDLSIAEGFSKKRSSCQVFYAFTADVQDAAMSVRYFGDLAAEHDDTGGALWGDRSWLEADPSEDEPGLATADGMNCFAAFVILCQVNVENFLNMSPEERMSSFGGQVGNDRIQTLNNYILNRLQLLQDEGSSVSIVQ